MRILTNSATVACDPYLASLVAHADDQNERVVVCDDVSVESLSDSNGQPAADAILLRGITITPHLLSG